MFFDFGNALRQAWYGLCILIDSLVYSLISIAYQVFNLIAKASLYNSENGDIKVMVERISVILGIGMLFIIAYNIILNIICFLYDFYSFIYLIYALFFQKYLFFSQFYRIIDM